MVTICSNDTGNNALSCYSVCKSMNDGDDDDKRMIWEGDVSAWNKDHI